MPTVHLLDYVAGNIRSLVNAINQVGYEVEWIKCPEDVQNADVRDFERLRLWGLAAGILLLTLPFVEIDSPWRRSFWPLSFPTRQRRLSGADSAAHRSWEAVHGYLCRPAGPLSGI